MRNILVVDDEQSIREFITHLLSGKDCAVAGFGDGPSALAYLASGNAADLVIADYLMPGMDGLEFVRRFRELHPDTPVLFLTGHGDLESYMQASSLGVARFIQKPVKARDLLDIVRETIGPCGTLS
jgi:DNA-binding NtrC family response regulator